MINKYPSSLFLLLLSLKDLLSADLAHSDPEQINHCQIPLVILFMLTMTPDGGELILTGLSQCGNSFHFRTYWSRCECVLQFWPMRCETNSVSGFWKSCCLLNKRESSGRRKAICPHRSPSPRGPDYVELQKPFSTIRKKNLKYAEANSTTKIRKPCIFYDTSIPVVLYQHWNPSL